MRRWLALLIILNLFGLASLAWADIDCQCERTPCGPCETDAGIDFYTVPCGEGGKQMKSCARPRCERLRTASARCPDTKVPGEAVAPRQEAPQAVLERVAVHAGTVVAASGQVFIHRLTGGMVEQLANIRAGFKVLEKDVVETHEGRVKIAMIDKNELVLTPNTRLEVTRESYQPAVGKRNTLINLIYGKLRSSVLQKYDGQENTFEIKTPVAVARVRGTDFVTSYSQEGDAVMRVHTFSGTVQLGPESGLKTVAVKDGTEASYIVDQADVRRGSVGRGFFSTVSPMTDSTVQTLMRETYLPEIEARGPASRAESNSVVAEVANDPICGQPTGLLNQCAWSCEGNPRGETRCRLDKPQVRCIRRRCNANGQWADESRVPAHISVQRCQSPTAQVGECDY